MTDEEIDEVWDRYSKGESGAVIARQMGWHAVSINDRIRAAGGIRPPQSIRSRLRLSFDEREEISRGLAAGDSCRAIARRLDRSPSTISREVTANGGRDGYRALAADRAAKENAKRPKVCKLVASPRLRRLVEDKLAKRWSPEQIAGWLARTHPGDAEMCVSHETIYRSLYIQSRGALKHELTTHLRTKRTVRRAKGHRGLKRDGRGQITNAMHISQRPAEAEDRAVPGHWEGDLILGKGMSAMGVLVERSTRLVLLTHLEGIKSEQVVAAIARQIVTLPEQLRRSLTWDQGKEMSRHLEFTVDTGVQIYFCDPKSPWQRGSNENTNGLLRQYFPKRSDLKPYTQADLDAVAAELNGRPRKTLEFMTPSEKFAQAVASTR